LKSCRFVLRILYMGLFDIFEVDDTIIDRCEIFISNRVISQRVHDRKIAHVYINKREKSLESTKRKKFINNIIYT